MQFLYMNLREPVQNLLSAGCNLQAYTATVGRIGCALQQAVFCTAVHQFHHGIVLQLQLLGCIGDGRAYVWRRAGDCQEQLMLLRVKVRAMRCFFTGKQKDTQLMTKFGQCSMERPIGIAESGDSLGHQQIISHHDIYV